ncbi:MAG: DUF732 domain-containing protein [Actinomycetota bacterium]|nr:DUF732 domain-containing protein [Actinomycetota bacterium]
MTRTARLVACGVGALLIANVVSGCGSTKLSPEMAAQQRQFLDAVHVAAPDVNGYRTDVDLTRLGRAVCDDLRSGASYQTVADRLGTTAGASRLPSADLGAVITSAASVYCPQYTDRIN